MASVAVIVSERLARYGFGEGHPFGPDRLAAFVREFSARGLAQRALSLEMRTASDAELRSFHSPEYLEFVKERSASGAGLLDAGDTPAFKGVYEAAAGVVGATLRAMEAIMQGECRRAFVPITRGVMEPGDRHEGAAHIGGTLGEFGVVHSDTLKHFPPKWIPVRRRKCDQTNESEP